MQTVAGDLDVEIKKFSAYKYVFPYHNNSADFIDYDSVGQVKSYVIEDTAIETPTSLATVATFPLTTLTNKAYATSPSDAAIGSSKVYYEPTHTFNYYLMGDSTFTGVTGNEWSSMTATAFSRREEPTSSDSVIVSNVVVSCGAVFTLFDVHGLDEGVCNYFSYGTPTLTGGSNSRFVIVEPENAGDFPRLQCLKSGIYSFEYLTDGSGNYSLRITSTSRSDNAIIGSNLVDPTMITIDYRGSADHTLYPTIDDYLPDAIQNQNTMVVLDVELAYKNKNTIDVGLQIKREAQNARSIYGFTSKYETTDSYTYLGYVSEGQRNPLNASDFYSFYAAASDGLEWINLHESTTSLKSAHGYLYANSEDVTLKSTGPAISITGGAALSIQYDPTDNYSYNGWNLAGNPYVCNGYVKVTKNNEIVETDFYRMNTDGDGYDLISSADALAPYEGVLVFIEGEQGQYEIGFSPDPIASNSGKLNMNLSRNGKSVDMARVRFGKGQNLGKMTFHENSSKVFIPMDGKDYAMVYSEGNMGEMPVSFKAERNGNYTLSFTNEDVTFSYLHLIDNLTGIETDLLENSSYTFEASTTDYAQRFRLVFTTGTSVDGDSFGFVNASGNLCIFGIEGEATVQVIDILGHVISSETFSGSYEKKINGAPGVYVIRLINGNDVKVQKVVVR